MQTCNHLDDYTCFPGSLSTPTIELIKDGAKLAKLAYCLTSQEMCLTSDQDIKSKISNDPKLIECTECDAQAFIFDYKPTSENSKSKLVISVRGTSSIMDWMCNISTHQTKLIDFFTGNEIPGVMVHAGFYRQFCGLFGIFNEEILCHLDNGGELMCIGHSLGAAVSCIAACFYGMKYPGQVGYIGYGGPRCGNDKFEEFFMKNIKFYYRCKNAHDPVPACIPPISYSHVGPELHLGPNDPLPDIPILFDVMDHSLVQYIAAMEHPILATAKISKNTQNWAMKLLSNFSLW